MPNWGDDSMSLDKRPSRRSVLKTALAACAIGGSGLAAKFGASRDSHESAPSESPDHLAGSIAASTLHFDKYTMHTGDRGSVQRQRGDQTLLRATLSTEDGESVGELFASAMTMPGPIEPGAPRTPRMEIQNFQLADGTILGMGTMFADAGIPNVYTVFGGSGRYAGARGSYRFDDSPTVARPEGNPTIKFELTV